MQREISVGLRTITDNHGFHSIQVTLFFLLFPVFSGSGFPEDIASGGGCQDDDEDCNGEASGSTDSMYSQCSLMGVEMFPFLGHKRKTAIYAFPYSHSPRTLVVGDKPP
jgi:hypothetical protein